MVLNTEENNRVVSPAQPLDYLFSPRSVAIVGASADQDKVGSICLSNLIQGGYKGRIYPVNPSLSEVMGIKAYPAIGVIPD